MEKKYKTAPLRCWNKAKEIRMNIYQEIAEAKQRGKILIGGGAESLIAIPTGFDHAILVGELWGGYRPLTGRILNFTCRLWRRRNTQDIRETAPICAIIWLFC
jgi:hypothetical protein